MLADNVKYFDPQKYDPRPSIIIITWELVKNARLRKGGRRKVVIRYRLPVTGEISTEDMMYRMVTVVNTIVCYVKVVKRVDLKRSCHKEKRFFSFFASFYCIWIWGHYHGNHFAVNVSETIVVYILNLNSDICQFYLKTGKKGFVHCPFSLKKKVLLGPNLRLWN